MVLFGQYQCLLEKMFRTIYLLKMERFPITESVVYALQNQAIKTRCIKSNVYHTMEDDTCKICNEYKETIHLIVSGYPKYINKICFPVFRLF